MSMQSMQQTIVYWINLPQFILNFKNHVVNMILPQLISLREAVNNQGNSEVVNPLVIILAVIVLLIVLKNIWNLLFEKRERKGQVTEPLELNNQINDLRKQLKSLKTSFFELTKQLNTNKNPQATQVNKSQAIQQIYHEKETLNNLLELYSASLQQNKYLIDYVLESQCQVLKQLKKFKKLNRNSLSSSERPSMSTVRSKTTEKQLKRKDKSPSKVNKMQLETEVKKSILKSSQRQQKPYLPVKKIEQRAKEESLQSEIKEEESKPQIKLPIRVQQKPKNPSVPKRQINQKVETQISVKEEKVEIIQQTLIPVAKIQQTQALLPHTEMKVEVQTTTIKESQSTEVVNTMDGVQTINSQETKFLTETKITTQAEYPQQNGLLTNPVPQIEEVVVINPQKPPQLKKSMAPPGVKPTIKRPPPPPRK